MVLTNQDWEDLLYFIEKKKCTPFIGAEALRSWVPFREWINEWADGLRKDYGYPVDDSAGLPGVAQFMAIADGSELTPKNNLSRKLELISIPNFSLEMHRNTPYAILADLNLPIYITTNYDHFLEQALRSRGKQPVSEFCAWNEELKNDLNDPDTPTALNKQFTPDESRPLVYHMHGDANYPPSMVLTHRDYFDFVTYLSKEIDTRLPSVIRRALSGTTLLFIGHDLQDIDFLVIFQGVINLIKPQGVQRKSIAVQFTSEMDSNKREQVEKYLDQYTNHMFKIHVYWGGASDFSKELRERWDKFKRK